MYVFSTESGRKSFSILVDKKVTAVLEGDFNKSLIHLRDEEDIKEIFFKAAKSLASAHPQEFKEMQDLIKDDNAFWLLSQRAVLELISELQSLIN